MDLDNTSGTINAAQLGADCITAAKIADDAFVAANFATGALTADAFAANALVAATFAASSLNGKGDWNTVVPDAAGVVATALGTLETHGDSTWATATSVTVSDKTGFSLANGSIVTATFGTSAITATVLAADCITSSELSTTAVQEIADNVLKRAVENVEDAADKHSLGALVMIASNASVSGAVLTAKKPSDDSTFQTYTVTVDADADPITGVS